MKMKRNMLILFTGLLAINYFCHAQDLPRLAVVEFSTNISTDKTRADAITVRNLVESQMVGTGRFMVITRSEIDQLLANQRIQVSNISSAENIRRLQLENISYIVTGSVDAMDNDYAITVRVLDVSTGRFSHSDSGFMGSGSRDLFDGISSLMRRFTAAMITDERGAIVQADTFTPSPSGISIQVRTDRGGDLYFQGERITTLWDNDTHTIPIERPGTFSLYLRLLNGDIKIAFASITTRGALLIDFATIAPIGVGSRGPAGGIVFYDKGSFSDGWRFLEAAPAATEIANAHWGRMAHNIPGTSAATGTGRRNTELVTTSLAPFVREIDRAAQLAAGLNIGGFTDWFLPSRDELNLMYRNLHRAGLGGFRSGWYWSSSQFSVDSAWCQNFSDGAQSAIPKVTNSGNLYSVRAIRAF